MLELQLPVEQWAGAVRTVALGATSAEGGSRTSTVTLGGDSTLPFLTLEGASTPRPALAMEVLDVAPGKWSVVADE